MEKRTQHLETIENSLNTIVDNLIVCDAERMDNLGIGMTFGVGLTLFFLPMKFVERYKNTIDIIKQITDLGETVLEEEITNEILEVIADCKTEGKAVNASLLMNALEQYTSLDVRTYEVFHHISGIFVDSPAPLCVGGFCFHQYDQYSAKIDLAISNEDMSMVFKERIPHTSVSVKTNARTMGKAVELATVLFTDLERVLRCIVFSIGSRANIGIMKHKWKNDPFVLIHSNGIGVSDSSSEPIPVSINKVLSYEASIKLVELISKKGKTKIEKKILDSSLLIGRSAEEGKTDYGFLSCVFALESLLNLGDNPLLLKNVTSQVASGVAFILADEYEKRMEIDESIREVYTYRSKLAHGANVQIPDRIYSDAYNYAKEIMYAFLIKEDLQNIKDTDDLRKYLKEKEYR